MIDYHESRQHIRQVFLSKDEAIAFLKNRIRNYWEKRLTNREDAYAQPEVPAEVREKLKVHFIKHISELLPLALRGK